MIVIKRSKAFSPGMKVDEDTLIADTISHQSDVREAILFVGEKLNERGAFHDMDKLENMKQFHADYCNDFKDSKWWKGHRNTQRHHFKDADKRFEDLDLIDVIETICDCVVAGKARSGTVYPIVFKAEDLMLAVENTVKMLERNIEVGNEE